ncbi:ATP-grasp domain-containing protein [Paucibacter sp. APW11]|uniref:ATP-grasp domain-containing protein n=1 Tax=Roseateles aquae TaxID=3077235 RepID=A0ABU3PBB8_9BURK|nr:ATP-grasp domain-containing protein [Paucibacter sp. APW11]MDT8999858.1 ATP-grasp domain-containing protein [Paucibacter sp. APW11]
MKSIAFIGASEAHLDRARALGYRIHLVQQAKNISTRLLALADDALLCDYEDPTNDAKVLAYLRASDALRPICFKDEGLLPIGRYMDQLHGSTSYSALAQAFTDKVKMRELLAGTALDNVAFQAIAHPHDLTLAARRLGFPFIAKPRFGVGSQGIKLVRTAGELEQLQLDDPYIAEQYIDGEEFSVESFSDGGRHTIHAITHKLLFPGNGSQFVERGHQISLDYNSGEQAQGIHAAVQLFLDRIGMRDGVSHTELKVCNGQVHIIESHNRAGGDSIPNLVLLSTGVDLFELQIRQAAGDAVDTEARPLRCNAGVLFFDFKPGQMRYIAGVERALLHPQVKNLYLPKMNGAELKQPRSSFSRNGYVVGTAPTDSSVIALLQGVESSLLVRYEDTKN